MKMQVVAYITLSTSFWMSAHYSFTPSNYQIPELVGNLFRLECSASLNLLKVDTAM